VRSERTDRVLVVKSRFFRCEPELIGTQRHKSAKKRQLAGLVLPVLYIATLHFFDACAANLPEAKRDFGPIRPAPRLGPAEDIRKAPPKGPCLKASAAVGNVVEVGFDLPGRGTGALDISDCGLAGRLIPGRTMRRFQYLGATLRKRWAWWSHSGLGPIRRISPRGAFNSCVMRSTARGQSAGLSVLGSAVTVRNVHARRR